MKELNATVGVFDAHDTAAQAVKVLNNDGVFGALLGVGIGKDKVLKYRQDLEAGRCLVANHGMMAEIKYFRSRNQAKPP